MKKTVFGLALLAFSSFVTLPAWAAEPSLHEVYQAAQAGRMDDARRMMHEVLQAHPNSGKAHYVEAELLAKQGRIKEAETELGTAERLAPGLPFANAAAVSSLRSALGERHAGRADPLPQALPEQPAPARFPWPMIGIGVALLAFIAWAARFMARRAGSAAPAAAAAYGGYRGANPGPSFGTPFPSYGPGGVAAPPAGGGLGSQIVGGLATGAAIGAGLAAGEALVHHFTDGHNSDMGDDVKHYSGFDSIPHLASDTQNDLGGQDFGIADVSSWDDGAAAGDDEWN